MRDRIRKIFVLGIFCTAVAGVWALGAVKAELDQPYTNVGFQVDPAIVRAALLADPNYDPRLHGDSAGASYLQAS